MNHLLLSSIIATGLALSGVSSVYAARQYGNTQETMKETGSSHENYGSQVREYTVKPGNTLASIAEQELGSAAKWHELARVNNLENPNRITVGEKLTIRAGQENNGSAMDEENSQQQNRDAYTSQKQSDTASGSQ